MKILVVSNLYPPHFIGGYELGCAWIVDQLNSRGHHVTVLTSTYGIDEPRRVGSVWRLLYHGIGGSRGRFAALMRRERANRRTLRKAMAELQPDLVYVWNPIGISLSLGPLAQRLGVPTVHYVSDDWPSHVDGWFRFTHGTGGSALKRVAGRLASPLLRVVGLAEPLRNEHVAHAQCVSSYIRDLVTSRRDGAMPVVDGEVIRWGVNVERYPADLHRPAEPDVWRIAVGGRLVETKGIHVVIDAFGQLARSGKFRSPARLSVIGELSDQPYAKRLKEMAAAVPPPHAVVFTGRIDSAAMPAALAEHDVFVLPSMWQEPFSILLVEAMASGLACIATRTGGTPEIIEDNANGLLVPPGDVEATRHALDRMLNEPGLARQLGRSARATVEARFTLTHMVEQIEASLARALHKTRR